MKIKHFLISLSATFCVAFSAMAQTTKDIGLISLNPYVPETENLGQNANSMLISKLQQIATANGMSGAGFDNRFIITAHIQKLKSSQTQTVPQKNAVEINVGIYVGDGLDGTLYSSYNCEVKGIGNSEDQAIAKGKKMILNYYDKMSGNIIQTAKSTAASGKYEDAINMLFAIPMSNKDFQTAQSLIAQYGRTSLEQKNLDIVRQARSAWSANPTEDGASKALELLENMESPSAKVQAEAKNLQNEMAARIKAVSDREFRLEAQKAQNEKDVQMATIRAAASVAKAYAASRPKVVYRYYYWW